MNTCRFIRYSWNLFHSWSICREGWDAKIWTLGKVYFWTPYTKWHLAVVIAPIRRQITKETYSPLNFCQLHQNRAVFHGGRSTTPASQVPSMKIHSQPWFFAQMPCAELPLDACMLDSSNCSGGIQVRKTQQGRAPIASMYGIWFTIYLPTCGFFLW